MSARRRLSRLAAGLAAALALAVPQLAAAKPPVWVAHSGATTITLFGSIHLLPAGLDWRPPELDTALARANELWFELPIDAATNDEAARQSIVRGALPKGRSLLAMMTPDQARRLVDAGVSLNCAPEALDRMQPWMADLTLSIAEDARSGASASDGVEGQIQALAPPTVRRRAFETATQQIGFLAGAPIKDQIASLNWTVSEIQQDPTSYQRAVDEWMSGDPGRAAARRARSAAPGLAEAVHASDRQPQPPLGQRAGSAVEAARVGGRGGRGRPSNRARRPAGAAARQGGFRSTGRERLQAPAK
ncbi:MAG: TraB/GumN family protein [Caulobacteraceae bacterium]